METLALAIGLALAASGPVIGAVLFGLDVVQQPRRPLRGWFVASFSAASVRFCRSWSFVPALCSHCGALWWRMGEGAPAGAGRYPWCGPVQG